jgi:hypothetical protein
VRICLAALAAASLLSVAQLQPSDERWVTPLWPPFSFSINVAHAEPRNGGDPARRQWFESQTINPDAMVRMGIENPSCCDAGDVYRTRFRIVEDGSKYGAERWQYLDKFGVWKTIPPDIIKDEPSIDAEPILFINKYSGQELCFFIGRGGT